MRPYAALSVLIFLFSPGLLRAGEPPVRPVAFPGNSLSDSLGYTAREIDYDTKNNRAVMRGDATVKYLGYTLKSHRIIYYQDERYVIAEGRKDSTGTLVDTPAFTDKTGGTMTGRTIEYNLQTNEGLVIGGRTKYETGYIGFDRVKRISADTLFISDGTYTTCENPHPHYYFAGKQMKLIVDDKLIIKPITAYIHDIPVLWFPFYVFPISKGRQSGFLTPQYGSSREDGRYVSNLGYYFAASTYWDYRFAATVRERNGWLFKNWVNYNVRYRMTGSLYGSFEERPVDGQQEWILRASHSQTVSPTLQIAGDANFQSSKYSQRNSYNIYEQLNRDVRSTLTVTKRWKESGNSLIMSLSHEKNLDDETSTTQLPSLSFRMPRRLLFGAAEKTETRRKYVKTEETPTESAAEKKWYESIYYYLNADMKNTNSVVTDTTEPDSLGDRYARNFSLSTGLSSSGKIGGWLVAEPHVTLSETFAATDAGGDSIKFRRNDQMTAGLSLSTTVYGTFAPVFGNVVGIRHVVTPAMTWSFGSRRQYYTNSSDAFLRLDQNDLDNSLVNTLDFSLRNIFQVKTKKGDSESKRDLVTLNLSSSVDFEDEEEKLSPIVATLDFSPNNVISTRLSASETFYDSSGDFTPLDPSFKYLTLTTSIGISRETLRFLSSSSRPDYAGKLERDDLTADAGVSAEDTETGREQGLGGGTSALPFNIRLSHTYGLTRNSTTWKYTTTHNIKPELSFSPSPNVSMNYYLYYDVRAKEIVSHRLSLTRNLHCFEANLNWVPSGLQEGFYFRVNIRELPDVKIEKRRGSSSLGY